MVAVRPLPRVTPRVLRRAEWFDLALAGALTVVGQAEVFGGLHFGGIGTAPAGPLALEATIALALTAPLALRRTRPITVAVIIAAALALQVAVIAAEVSLLAGLVPLLVAVYSAACYGRARLGAIGLVLGLVVQALFALRIPEERATGEVLFGLFVIVGAFLVGDVVGARHRAARAETGRLSRRLAEEQAGRAAWTAQVLAEERASIARELHDVIAHGVSVMGVQATAARVLLGQGDDRDRAAAAAAMLAIEDQARESVSELQRLLGVLRDTDDHADLAPQPGLAQLDRLVEQVRAAGLPVLLTKEGEGPLSAGVDMTAYRVVQEGLTNVLKHAGPVATTVAVHCDAHAVTIALQDAGPRLEGSPVEGHGLIGMRERVALYGGSLQLDTPPTGGLALLARIPLTTAQ